MHIYSQYLGDVFKPNDFRVTYEWVKRVLEGMSFDAIAFRGTSGAALAFPLSLDLNVPLIHIRKHMGHSCNTVEGIFDCRTYVIVDDIVCSGDTLREIKRQIQIAPRANHACPEQKVPVPECVGVIFYSRIAHYVAENKRDKVLSAIGMKPRVVFRDSDNQAITFEGE